MAEDPAALGTLKLWFEILGRALRPDASLKVQAQQLALRWERWLASKLPEDRRGDSPALFAEIVGILLLYCLNH